MLTAVVYILTAMVLWADDVSDIAIQGGDSMTTLYRDNQDCCGCTACQHACGQLAIRMMPDFEGFFYPVIDPARCSGCGECKEMCVFQNGYAGLFPHNSGIPKVFAAKHMNEEVRLLSSSGGVFSALSDHIIREGGLVVGASYGQDMSVSHQIHNSYDGRDRFRGSKYVQSNLGDVFKEVMRYLKQGTTVLFSGTPCQTAGLQRYLQNTKVGNLYLCDLVCHGVPSPLMWQEHLIQLGKKAGYRVVGYNSRDKVNGWHTHTEKVVYSNGKCDFDTLRSQMHKILFYSGYILRPACYHCRYTNLHRPSDVTIADYWGIEGTLPDFDDNRGVSLVLVNSDKGLELFERIKSSIIFCETELSDCLQPQLQHPSERPLLREQFWQDYGAYGYERVIRWYAGYTLQNRAKHLVKRVLHEAGLLDLVYRARRA